MTEQISTPDLERLWRMVQDRVERWRELWIRQHPIPTDTLYHYTDAHGLRGILTDGAIWATDYRYLNDPSEGLWAEELAQRIFGELRTPPWDPILKRAFDYYMMLQRSFRADTRRVLSDTRYLCAFSARGNDLSQWRAYGAGGHGYAVGVRMDRLAVMQAPNSGVSLRKVCYEEATQQRYVSGIVNSLQSLTSELQEATGSKQVDLVQDLVAQAFAIAFRELQMTFKSSVYGAEDEWRLISDGRGTTMMRVGGGVLIPYQTISLRDVESVTSPERWGLAINHILVGPAMMHSQAAASIRQLVQWRERPIEIRVEHSGLPYRN